MERRDRDNRNAPAGPRPNDQGARGRSNGPMQPRRAAPAPQAAPRVPSYEDPNAYRSPGFQDQSRSPYKIDYAGLPKDDEDPDGTQPQPGNSLEGNRSSAFQPPRGMNGRRQDRAGTDPNAYRSPSYQGNSNGRQQPSFRAPQPAPAVDATADGVESADDAQPGTRAPAPEPRAEGPSRRERRSQRPRFEASCNACGAAAVVPFEPGPERPAFCKPCYEGKKAELGLGPGKRPTLTPTT